MHLQIARDALVNAVQHVIKAVEFTNPISILQGIHIAAGAEGIILTASNTRLTIQLKIAQDDPNVTISSGGSIVVPARYFYEVIKKLGSSDVLLELDKDHILTIASGHFHIRLCGMNALEFPLMDKLQQSSHKVRILNNHLRSAIKQVAIAASSSETRPVLTGVSFSIVQKTLTLTATDGIRLAAKTVYIDNDADERFSVIVPARSLYELSKMLTNEDEITEIEIRNHRIRFSSNGLIVDSALIDGAFPSIHNVIPKAHLSEIVVDRAQLVAAIECVSVLAINHVMKLVANGTTLQLNSRTAEVGDVHNEVPLLETMLGNDFTTHVNGRLLNDMLRNVDDRNVRIRFAGPLKPIIVHPADAGISAFLLITPLRTHH